MHCRCFTAFPAVSSRLLESYPLIYHSPILSCGVCIDVRAWASLLPGFLGGGGGGEGADIQQWLGKVG